MFHEYFLRLQVLHIHDHLFYDLLFGVIFLCDVDGVYSIFVDLDVLECEFHRIFDLYQDYVEVDVVLNARALNEWRDLAG